MGIKWLTKNVHLMPNYHLTYRSSKRHFMKKFGLNLITTMSKSKIYIPHSIQIPVHLHLLNPCHPNILKPIAIHYYLLTITPQNFRRLHGLIQFPIPKNLVINPFQNNISQVLLETTVYYPIPIIFQIMM